MGAPVASTALRVSHAQYITYFTESSDVAQTIGGYGYQFDDVGGSNVYAILVNPLYSVVDIMTYIQELGGTVYVRVEEPGQNN